MITNDNMVEKYYSDSNIFDAYLSLFYFTIAAFSTAGFGDITP